MRTGLVDVGEDKRPLLQCRLAGVEWGLGKWVDLGSRRQSQKEKRW